MKYDIIIPYYNNAELTKACIMSVINNSQNYRIIASSDGSASDQEKAVQTVLEKAEKFEHLRHPSNTGFQKNTNRGLRIATAEFIAVINSDFRVCHNWLNQLEAEFLRRGKNCFVGTSGCRVNSKGFNIRQNPTFPEVDYLGWSLIFSSRECFNRVGLFDEHFVIGYYEDVDYGLRAKKLGIKSFVIHLPIWHKGGASMNKVNSVVLAQARAKNYKWLRQKWNLH